MRSLQPRQTAGCPIHPASCAGWAGRAKTLASERKPPGQPPGRAAVRALIGAACLSARTGASGAFPRRRTGRAASRPPAARQRGLAQRATFPLRCSLRSGPARAPRCARGFVAFSSSPTGARAHAAGAFPPRPRPSAERSRRARRWLLFPRQQVGARVPSSKPAGNLKGKPTGIPPSPPPSGTAPGPGLPLVGPGHPVRVQCSALPGAGAPRSACPPQPGAPEPRRAASALPTPCPYAAPPGIPGPSAPGRGSIAPRHPKSPGQDPARQK